MSVQLLRRRFTVQEYHQMAEAGVLSEDERVELIEGEIVHMAAIGSRHAAAVKRLNHLFFQHLSGRAVLGVQDPIQLSSFSEPQPDVALLRPRVDFYAQGHPQPADVFLVVEVADTSVGFDRDLKAPLYARSGILEMWLVNLSDDYVAVYRQPHSTGYQDVRRMQRGQRLAPQAFPELELAVDDILG
jgi:Uma2 family endonuclease